MKIGDVHENISKFKGESGYLDAKDAYIFSDYFSCSDGLRTEPEETLSNHF